MSRWDSERGYRQHETGRPTNEQRLIAMEEARKRIENPARLAETRQWIYDKRRSVQEIRALFTRWGMRLPHDMMEGQ